VKLTRRQWIGLGLGSVPVLAAADAFLVEPGWLRQTDIVLDPGRRTCRLVHFTDLHYRGDELALRALVKRIDRLAPDLVCFTGDITEDSRHLDEALDILRRMKAPLYGVPGNHEDWSEADPEKISLCFASTGGAWLPDRWAYALSSRVRITGVDKNPVKAAPEEGKLNILLMHYPAPPIDWARSPSTSSWPDIPTEGRCACRSSGPRRALRRREVRPGPVLHARRAPLRGDGGGLVRTPGAVLLPPRDRRHHGLIVPPRRIPRTAAP